jgi:UDP-2,3-diacylglucosamine hydrolase
MTHFFISDCHLSPAQPEICEKFFQLLKTLKNTSTLYILGDFFNRWIGDDEPHPFYQLIRDVLASYTRHGLTVFIMQGNRDFLLQQRFCQQSGCQLLADPCVITLYGNPILLTHGDTLCTEDTRYQLFRKFTHSPLLQKLFLQLPIAWRSAIASRIQGASQVTRVNADTSPHALDTLFTQYGVAQIIHGHTHKPAIVLSYATGEQRCHYVLSDWHKLGHFLSYEPNGNISSRFF